MVAARRLEAIRAVSGRRLSVKAPATNMPDKPSWRAARMNFTADITKDRIAAASCALVD